MGLNIFKSKSKKEEEKDSAPQAVPPALNSLSNVVIHTMPKSYLHQGKPAKHKHGGLGLVILAVGSLALLLIFTVLYVYLSQGDILDSGLLDSTDSAPQRLTPVDESEWEEARPPAGDEAAEDKAAVPEDGSGEAAPAGGREEAEPENGPKEDEARPVKVIDLGTATGTAAAATATPAEAEAATSSRQSFSLAADSDNDGLYDAEEGLLGCDKAAPDSDNDGYDDLSELMNLYNPAGQGQLITNPAISRYTNPEHNYTFYYPSAWGIEQIDGEDSIMFDLGQGQFLQVIAAASGAEGGLEAWYKEEFGVSYIDPARKIYKAGWQGVRSEDGLTAYMQKTGEDKIYTLSYNLGIDSTLYYKNIFEMMLRSIDI